MPPARSRRPPPSTTCSTIVADAARDVIGARHGVARRGPDGAPPGPRLVAPLVARDGSSLGLIELWDKDGEFTADDEAIVIQLAQMAANAIETLELLNREHAARVEAEETGRRLLLEKQRAEALQRVGSAIAGRLELQEIVQLATDAARELTPASFGAFFYNVISDAGEAYMLYTLSGVERSAFERFPMPRNTAIFAPTFNGEGIVRLDDVPGRPALRPQRALPRHARGPPAGPQLPRRAGDHERRRGRGRAVLRPPRAGHVLGRGRADGRGDRRAVGDRDRERAPVPGAHAHRADAPARAAAAAPARGRGPRAGRDLPRRGRGQRGRRRLLRRLPAGRRELGAGRRRRLRQGAGRRPR